MRDEDYLIDNLFADLWKHMDMKARLNRIGFPKHSGAWAGVLSDDFCLVESGLNWHACAGVIEDFLLRREICLICGFESGRLELVSSA